MRWRQSPTSTTILNASCPRRVEGWAKPLNELILLPALNLRGILGGHVEELASNTISTEAKAIDFSLAPAETPEKVRDRVERHIAGQNFFIVRETPDASTRMAHPNVIKLVRGPGIRPPGRRWTCHQPPGRDRDHGRLCRPTCCRRSAAAS
jgi:hypothetical protein